MGFQTSPLIMSVRVGCVGSLQVTVAFFTSAPPKLAVLSCSAIVVVWPGSIRRSQVPAVVHPQPGRTSLISNGAFPVLVRTKRGAHHRADRHLAELKYVGGKLNLRRPCRSGRRRRGRRLGRQRERCEGQQTSYHHWGGHIISHGRG